MDQVPVRLPSFSALPSSVIFDLDGTLFDPAGALSPRSDAAVRWLLDREVSVVIATARPLRVVRGRLAPDVLPRVSVIHMNGVGVAQRGESVEAPSSLPPAAASRIIALAATLTPFARVVCEIDGHTFGCDATIEPGVLWELNSATPDMVIPTADALERGVVKIAVNGFGQSLSALALRIDGEAGDLVTVIREASGSFLNIVPPGTSKEAAVERLIASGDPWLGMLAFGDDLSDIEVLRRAEHGVAMANAHPDVIAAARYLTSSNADDGVAEVLDRLRAGGLIPPSGTYTDGMYAARWIASALFIACVPVFLVLSNVRLAATEEAVYHYGFSAYNVPAVTGLERAQLDRAAREIVAYFTSGDPTSLLDIRVTTSSGESQPLYNEREVIHMRDVKQLFQFFFRMHEVAFAYIVAYVAGVYLWSREQSLRRLARQAVQAGVITAVALGLAAMAMLVGFDQLFVAFHIVSFANDFWQLNPATDRLVQMFPQGFWFDVSVGVGVLTILEGGLVALGGYAYLEWSERRAERRRRARARARAEAEGIIVTPEPPSAT